MHSSIHLNANTLVLHTIFTVHCRQAQPMPGLKYIVYNFKPVASSNAILQMTGRPKVAVSRLIDYFKNLGQDYVQSVRRAVLPLTASSAFVDLDVFPHIHVQMVGRSRSNMEWIYGGYWSFSCDIGCSSAILGHSWSPITPHSSQCP